MTDRQYQICIAVLYGYMNFPSFSRALLKTFFRPYIAAELPANVLPSLPADNIPPAHHPSLPPRRPTTPRRSRSSSSTGDGGNGGSTTNIGNITAHTMATTSDVPIYAGSGAAYPSFFSVPPRHGRPARAPPRAYLRDLAPPTRLKRWGHVWPSTPRRTRLRRTGPLPRWTALILWPCRCASV